MIFIAISFFVATLHARNWDKIKIPGALCGDGRPYFVFLDASAKKSNQLFVEFMGGGACWSYDTCYTGDRKTWVHPIPELPSFSYLTNDISIHPFRDDNALYMPYCTGDVHAANHMAQYQDKKAYHMGYSNIVKALEYLKQTQPNLFSQTQRLTVFGTSAGAIGAMVHLRNFETYFPQAKKYAIIDSPGLHFGPTFWSKFTPEIKTDFKDAFNSIGLYYPENDGFLAQYMGPVFKGYKNWNIGILQSTRDQTMSLAFGDISQDDHEKLVLSDRGLPAIAQGYPNIKTWISHSDKHIFLMWTIYAETYKDENGQSAASFVRSLMKQ